CVVRFSSRLPASTSPPLGIARTSCPWHGTAPWQQRVQRGLALDAPSWHTGCRSRGDNGPYTQVLLSNALPAHPNDVHAEVILPGEVPSPLNPPGGCRFHPRCPQAVPVCAEIEPLLRESSPGHRVACHLYHNP